MHCRKEVRKELPLQMLHFFAAFALPSRPFAVKGFKVAKSIQKGYNFPSPAFSRQPEETVVSSNRRSDSATAISSS
jgi:hypothetical protein